MHVLLLEDDLDLGDSLARSLRAAEFSVEWLRRAVDAKRFVASHTYDAIVIDLELPDGHGLDLLRAWRSQGLKTPLLIITASQALDARLTGLDGGADDYLVKPFAVAELIARIHAVTRRTVQQATSIWRLGDLTLDVMQRACSLRGQTVDLSKREFDILLVLARQAGEVCPKHRLAQALEPLGEPVDFNTIEVHVHNLRRKLDAESIRTIRGVGYLLTHAQ
jgi:two-component system, OmpR family, response regulator QseB